jgi:hypothetical protein
MTAKEIYQYMIEKDKSLRSDTDFEDLIYVRFICGSEFKIQYAQFEQKEDYLIIFTEHFGCFFSHMDEVEEWKILEK